MSRSSMGGQCDGSLLAALPEIVAEMLPGWSGVGLKTNGIAVATR
jgi:hypothetical protein